MSKFIVLILIIFAMITFQNVVIAKELCDCYGSCIAIQPRDVGVKEKKAVKIKDGYNLTDDVDIDHILPLCLGGTNDIGNLQALTKEVHKIKTEHDMLILYYVQNCLMTIEEAQSDVKNWRKEEEIKDR